MAASAQGRDWSSFQRPVTSGMMAGLTFGAARVSDWRAFPSMSLDVNFRWDFLQMRSFGLIRMAYWYLRCDSGAPLPESQAAYFCDQVKIAGIRPGDWLACDSEEVHTNTDSWTLRFQREVAVLLGAIVPRGLRPIYTNGDTGHHLVTASEESPLWIAWPPPGPGEAPDLAALVPGTSWVKSGWLLWQWGITRDPAPAGPLTDADAFNGTPSQMRSYIAAQLATLSHSGGEAASSPGDTMFTIPAGDGQTFAFPVPVAVLREDGSIGPPAAVRLACNTPTAIEYMLGTSGTWVPLTVDYNRSPAPIELNGAAAVKFQRTDKGPQIAGDFA